jgi:hypothetical protein
MDIIAIGVPAGPYYQTMLASPNGTLRRVAVSGNYAYLASSNFFYIYNWVQSSAEYSPLTWAYSLAMGGTDGAMDVALQGKYAYVVGAKGLSIFDVTNPMAPVGPWFFATADPLSEVEVDGAYAYVYGSNKLSILDITDPAHVIQVSGLDYAGYAMNMRKSGSFLYLPLYRDSPTSNYGLTIIDVTAPLHPTLRGNYHDAVNLYNGMDVSVQEDNAFLVQSDTGLSLGRLSLINLANKDAPAEGSSYTPGP